MISSRLGSTSRKSSKADRCSYSEQLGALSTKDLTIADPSVEYAKRPRSSILEVFNPSLFELEDIPRRITRTVNGFGEEIVRVDGEIPVDLEVNNGDRFLFISYDQSVLTHGLHKYPAKFFPELPRWLIHRYSKEGDWIIDPFTGSATVNLECLLARRNSIGIDVDPFSRFLARVKLTPLNVDALRQAHLWLKREISKYESNIPKESEFPVFPYRDNWFNKFIVEELTFLKKLITGLKKEPLVGFEPSEVEKITNFFLICLSSIIRSVSNADDNCTRTVIRKKLNKRVCKGDALVNFTRVIDTNVPKMVMFSEICPANITVDIPDQNDAREIKYPDETFHLAVTSPPYVNAVDYPRTHQLEMYWLGIENGSLVNLKKLHIGTETVSHSEYRYLHRTGLRDADEIIAKIHQKDPRRSFILYKYLIDMEANMMEVRRVLRPGGKYAIVVGNNKIRGCLVESRKYLTVIAERVGFKVHCYFASEIIKHFIKVPREERINTDWVVVLER